MCAVGYQWRSLALLGRVRDELAGVAPGMLISRSVGPTEPGRAASWFGDPAASGGILFELGSHDIDLQQALAGPAESVQALSGRGLGTGGGALDDAVAVLVRYEGGGLGVISVAWTEQQEPPIYELDVLAPDVALHLALDPERAGRGPAPGARPGVPVGGPRPRRDGRPGGAGRPAHIGGGGLPGCGPGWRSGGGGMHAGGCAGHAAGGAGGGAGDRDRGDGQALADAVGC